MLGCTSKCIEPCARSLQPLDPRRQLRGTMTVRTHFGLSHWWGWGGGRKKRGSKGAGGGVKNIHMGLTNILEPVLSLHLY